MKHFYMAVALFLSSTSSAQAQEKPAGADLTQELHSLRKNSLQVVGTPSFFTNIAIERDGQRIDIGAFGSDAAPFFTERGLARASLQAFRTKKITGVTLWSVGLAALAADLALIISDARAPYALERHMPLQWGLLIGGALTGVTGGVLTEVAQGHLLEAVSQHNSALLDDVIEQSTHPALGLSVHDQGASVSLTLGL